MKHILFDSEQASYRAFGERLCDQIIGVDAAVSAPSSFRLAARLVATGESRVMCLDNRGDPVEVARTSRRIAADPVASWVVGVCLEGSQRMALRSGAELRAQRSELIITRSDVPHVGVTGPRTRVGLIILHDGVSRSGWTPVQAGARDGLARVLSESLRTMFEELPRLSAPELETLLSSVLPLIAAVAAPSAAATELAGPSVRDGDTVATGVNSLVSGAEEVLSFPRSILAQTITVGADLDEALANSTVQLPLSVYQACLDLQQDCAHFGSLADDYFAKPWTSRVSALTGNVNKTYGASGDASGQSDAGGGDGDVGGTSSGLGGSGTRNGAREDSPRAGESIQDFALRVCGDATMWGVIAEMNNLRYPYFSQSQQNRADGTLAPGDTCIYPVRSGGIPGLRPVKADRTFTDESVASVNTSTTLVRRSVGRWRDGEWIGYTVKVVDGWGAGQERLITGNTSNTLTVDVAWSAIPNDTSVFTIYKPTYQRTAAAAEQTSFGRDLMVRRQNDGTYDLVRNNNGDVASVTGVPNISQAVELKFVVLKGQLPLHPWYGADMGIGVKGSVEALAQHRLAVEQTILSDTRVKAVRDLSVSFQNGVETVTATLEYVDGRRVPYTSTLR